MIIVIGVIKNVVFLYFFGGDEFVLTFMFCFLLNRVKTLLSYTLHRMATKRWLKHYCLLEQMFIFKAMFVIFMIVVMKIVDLFVLIFFSCFGILFCFK